VHVVDQVGRKKLMDGRRASTDADVPAASSLLGKLQRFARGGIDEMERRPARHLDRGPLVMGEHVHRSVKRRVIAPPALPLLVSPQPELGSKLVPAHDLDADVRIPVAGEGIVDAGASACVALRVGKAAKGASGKELFVEPVTSVAEGRLESLTVTGAESVERDREVVDSNA
jgi:hypothetical protein